MLPMITTVYALELIVGGDDAKSLLCKVANYILYLFITLSKMCRPAVLTMGSSGRLTRSVEGRIPRKIICSCASEVVQFCYAGCCVGGRVQGFALRGPRRKCIVLSTGTRRRFLGGCGTGCRLRRIFRASCEDYSLHGAMVVCGFGRGQG